MRVFMIVLLVTALTSLAGGDDFERTVDYRIEIQSNGTARITRIEKVPSSELSRAYQIHGREMENDPEVRDNFFDQMSREMYLLYGTTPDRESFSVKFDFDDQGNYTSTVSLDLPGLVRKGARATSCPGRGWRTRAS